jgi:uncharacterized protein YjbI with pentapeptide repeats
MTRAELGSRWDPRLAAAVNAALGVNAGRKGGFAMVPDLPGVVGEFDGRVDLRGLEVTEMLKGFHLVGWDFSHCRFTMFGQLSAYNQLEDCRFTGARMTTNLRDRFRACDFSGATLTGAVFGRAFTECRFDRAGLSKILADQAVFERCSFRGTKAKGLQLTACRFIGCDFEGAHFSEGSLAGSTFEDCAAEPVLDKVMR